MMTDLVIPPMNGSSAVLYRALWNQPTPYHVTIIRNGEPLTLEDILRHQQMRGPVAAWLEALLPPEFEWDRSTLRELMARHPRWMAYLPYLKRGHPHEGG